MDYLAALRAFTRAADLGSFSRAAIEAGIKVSTVSRYVAALEADLGAALLNRSTHGLALTEIGTVFHARAIGILADLDAARGLAASLNARPQGLLRVNLPVAFGRLHIIPHLPAFLADHPDIRLDLTLTDARVDLIEAGADVAIRIGALPDSGLIARRLAAHRRVVCAAPGLAHGVGALAAPADLARHPALIFSLQDGPAWHFREEGGREIVEVTVAGRVRANASEALLGLTIAGQGIGLLPTWLAGEALASGTLVRLLPGWEGSIGRDFDTAIWAIYPPKKVVSPKVRAFIDTFERHFRRPVYWEAATG